MNINFFGSSLTLVIVYVWSKRHADVAMGLFGVIPFRGAWLPYVMVGFSLMFGELPVAARPLGHGTASRQLLAHSRRLCPRPTHTPHRAA